MDLDGRLRRIEHEIERLKLGRRHNGRILWLLVACLIAAPFTMGITLVVFLGLLIWHVNACRREYAELCERTGVDLAGGASAGPEPAAETAEPTRPEGLSVRAAKPFDVEQWVARPLFLTLGTLALLLAAAYYIALPSTALVMAPAVRLGIIIVAGVLLLVVGHRQFQRVPAFGYALLGGGFGLLIISIYGLLLGYEDASYVMVYGLMLVVTIAMALISVQHNAWPLAALGLLGGFIAPTYIGIDLQLQQGRAAEAGVSLQDYTLVAVYLVILTAVSLVLHAVRKWQLLPFVALLFSYVVLGHLYPGVPGYVQLSATAAVFLLLLVGAIYRTLRERTAAQPVELILLVLNCAFFVIYGVERIYSGQPIIQGAIGVCCAILFALLASATPVHDARKRLMEAFAGLALVYLAISLVFLLQRDLEAIGLTLVAVLTVWLAGRLQSVILRVAGVLEMVWAAGMILFVELLDTELWWLGGEHTTMEQLPYLNAPFAGHLAVLAGIFLTLWLWHRAAGREASPLEAALINVGVVVANVVLLVLLQVQARSLRDVDWARQIHLHHVFAAASYLVHGIVLTYLGLRRDSLLLRYCGLALFGWTVVWAFFTLVIQGNLVARVITLSIIGACLIVASFWYYRRFAESK